jgi:hypothetical protein
MGLRGSRYFARAKDPVLVETWASTTDIPIENKHIVSYYNEEKTFSR